MSPPSAPLPPIDFAALAQALLPRAAELLAVWLPGGKVEGTEYVAHSVWRSEKTASLKVSLSGARAGSWADFGGDHRGGDLVGLYAAIHGLQAGQAAAQLAVEHGLERLANVVGGARKGGAPPPPPVQTPAPAPPEPPREQWTVVTPVPAHAPEPTFRHHTRRERPEHIARYERDGALHGFVVRFRTSDGGKDTLPYTWCTSTRDGASRWHWKTWLEPRPLYFPGAKSPDGRTVIVVEGERKADILQRLLDAGAPGLYCVVSWPGGSKAWKKADWAWLLGCVVLLWPDCDGKREPLSRAEASACLDEHARVLAQLAKPVLPAEKQPGMAAMLGIGALLRDQ